MTRIIWQNITSSTNDDAKALAEKDVAEPLWIAAEQQTQGRGRRGRSWQSAKGNLYASWLGKLDCSPLDAAQLSFVAALAVRETAEAFLPKKQFAFKWPNDVLLEGKKFCGILLELVIQQKDLWLIIGIGVNLLNAPKDSAFAATALGLDVGPKIFLKELAEHFDRMKIVWHDRGFSPIRNLWLNEVEGLGKEIIVRLPLEELSGIFETLTEQGALVLKTDSATRLIEAGDVFFTSTERQNA